MRTNSTATFAEFLRLISFETGLSVTSFECAKLHRVKASHPLSPRHLCLHSSVGAVGFVVGVGVGAGVVGVVVGGVGMVVACVGGDGGWEGVRWHC